MENRRRSRCASVRLCGGRPLGCFALVQRGAHAVADFQGVGGVDPEEDPQFFGGLSTCFDAFEAVVFFFVAEASFELGGALFLK